MHGEVRDRWERQSAVAWFRDGFARTPPRFERVRADVDGVGDEAPDTASADVLVLERVLARDRSEGVIPEEQLFVRVRDVLLSADGPEPVGDQGVPAVESCSSGGEGLDPGGDVELSLIHISEPTRPY